MSSVKAFLGVARAPFLLLPVGLIASGTAAAAWEQGWRWDYALIALLGLVVLHAAVNILNEVSDQRTGIDDHTQRTPFSGGSGTLQSGGMRSRTAQGFAAVFLVVGALAGFFLAARSGWLLVPIGLLGVATVLTYTDRLARLGVGELAAGLGLGALPVLGAAFVQQGRIGPAAAAIAVPACLMTFNLLLLNEFPDEQADRRGGRRHLVIALGRPAAARIYAAAALLTPAAIVAGVLLRVLPTAALLGVLPSLLLVQPVAWALRRPAEPVPTSALGANVLWNLATHALLAVGLFVA